MTTTKSAFVTSIGWRLRRHRIAFHMLRRFALSISLALGAQSCLIYDRELLDSARGGETNPGLGGDRGDGDGDGDVSGSGGSNPTGGASTGGGTGASTGGVTAGTGGMDSSGGSGGGTGGNGNGSGGTGGGSGTCDTTTGSKQEFSGVTNLLSLEDFGNQWSQIGSGDRFTGQWNVSQDGKGTDLTPMRPPEESWIYEHDPCFVDAGDSALHITGVGYSGWGAGYDANLMLNNAATSVAPNDGVVFWARSSAANQVRLAFSDETSEVPVETSLKLLKQTWTEYKVPFPAGIDKATLKVVHIVVVGSETFDLWFDDLNFYEE